MAKKKIRRNPSKSKVKRRTKRMRSSKRKTKLSPFVFIGSTMLVIGIILAVLTSVVQSGIYSGGSSPMQLQWITDYDQSKLDLVKSGNDYELETFTKRTVTISSNNAYQSVPYEFERLGENAVFLDIVSTHLITTYSNPSFSREVYIPMGQGSPYYKNNLMRVDIPVMAMSGMGTCEIAEILPWGNGGSVNRNPFKKIGQPISDLGVSEFQQVGGANGLHIRCVSPFPDGHFGDTIKLFSYTRDNVYEVLMASPRTNIPPELHFRYFTCPLNNNYQLVTESFAAGHTISNYAFRYPVNYYCANFPVITTSSVDFIGTTDSSIYPALTEGVSYAVPSGQTQTFFYVVANNMDLPTICDPNGAIDPITGRCIVSPGIIHICSQGQFDPAKGMCAVQPESIFICEEGGYYDVVQAKCIYHPPVQAVCEKGQFNVDKGVCEYTPDSVALCDIGQYNELTGLCEMYPDQMILCPGGYTYDQNLAKCIKYAASEVQCTSGGVYDAIQGICVITPPEQVVCGRGVYNEKLKVCVYTPDFTTYCPQGDYDPNLNACVIQPDLDYLCLRGTLTIDPITGLRKCTIIPEITVYCSELGGVYDADTDKCIITPTPEHTCVEGVLELIGGQYVCTVRPNVEVVCGNPDAHYVQELGVCQLVARLEHICVEGEPSTKPDGSVVCLTEATLDYQCSGGFEYDASANICLGSPEDIRFTNLYERVKSSGYILSGTIIVLGLILLTIGLI